MEFEERGLTPEVAESQVARAMETARKRAGLTVEAMVRRLRPTLRMREVPVDKKVGQNWYDWRDNPKSIPAVALVAAAEIAQTSIDSLLAPDQPTSSRRPSEGELAELRDELAQQRRHTTALETKLEQLAAHLASDRPAPNALVVEPATLFNVLDQLNAQMAEAGRVLDRPWADQAESDRLSTASGDSIKSLVKAASLIQARMVDLQGSVGLARVAQTLTEGHDLVGIINELTLQLAEVRGRMASRRPSSERRAAT